MSTSAIQGTLDGIIKYLNPFSSLINCHMVNYITDGHWKVFIPQNMQNEIQTKESIAEAIDVFWNTAGSVGQFSKLTNFIEFIEEGKKFSYDGLTHTWVDGVQSHDILSKIGCSVDAVDYLHIKEFMSEKKNHEVSYFQKLCDHTKGESIFMRSR